MNWIPWLFPALTTTNCGDVGQSEQAHLDWHGLPDTEAALSALDTLIWLVVGLNTSSQGWEYDIRLHSDGELVGVPPSATTPWLTFLPDDNQIRIQVEQDVPWRVDAFVVERQTPTGRGVSSARHGGCAVLCGHQFGQRPNLLLPRHHPRAYDDPSTEHPLINVSQEDAPNLSISRHHATWPWTLWPIARISAIR